jgi:hypothetical protein
LADEPAEREGPEEPEDAEEAEGPEVEPDVPSDLVAAPDDEPLPAPSDDLVESAFSPLLLGEVLTEELEELRESVL